MRQGGVFSHAHLRLVKPNEKAHIRIIILCTRKRMKTASFRLDESEDAEIEALAKRLKTDRSSIARRAIGMGIKELKKREALEAVRRHDWTVWRAASHCEESYRTFLRLLRFENVPFPLSAEELGRELDDNRRE